MIRIQLKRGSIIKCFKEINNQFNGRRSQATATSPGYFILGPDIPSDTPISNHLLYLPREEELTKFSLLNHNLCLRAFIKNSFEFEAAVYEREEMFKQDKPQKLDFNGFYQPLEKALIPLDYSWSVLKMLFYANRNEINTAYFMNLHRNYQIKRGKLSTSNQLYYYLREFNADRDELTESQRCLLDKLIFNSKLNGIDLGSTDFENFNHTSAVINQKQNNFRDNLNRASKQFRYVLSGKEVISSFPDDFIAKVGSENSIAITLEPTVYNRFLELCPYEEKRATVWKAYNMQCSNSGDKNVSNSIIIEEIRGNRKTLAELLGYKTYLDMTVETKMARSPENVSSMLNEMFSKTRDVYQNDLENLNKFSIDNKLSTKLNVWDLSYLKRKYILNKFSLNNEEIKEYFPLPKVLEGLTNFISEIFGVNIVEVENGQFDPWCPDVRLFRVFDGNRFAGSFYLDLFSRPGEKIGNASWIETPLSRCDALKVKPLVSIFMNIKKPALKNQPTLLYFEEILTLFARFGQMLQHVLTEMEYSEIAGLNNIEWDAVHTLPNFMTLWPLHNYKIIEGCSSNINTKKSLPIDLHAKIREAHYSFSSLNLTNELFKIALDLSLHSQTHFWKDIMDECWKSYMKPFELDKYYAYPCTFKEIFCGDYASFYYSFKWSEMLAADAFFAFQEAKIEDELPKIGKRFKDTFLSLGGGCKTSEVFRRFRGRDPSPDAFFMLNSLTTMNVEEAIKIKRN